MASFDDLVRDEAYLIWQAEGCPHGAHDRHWGLAMERVKTRQIELRAAPVIPLPLNRVTLSRRQNTIVVEKPLRASA